MESKSDEELLSLHVAGTRGAFDVLIDRYTAEVYGFLQRFVGNAAAVDDLVQETFLQVHLAAGTFDTTRPFKPWLYTIAANKARDHLRSRVRRQEHSLNASSPGEEEAAKIHRVPAEQEALEERVAAEERRELVRRTIARMPEHLRLILVLGYFQQLPYVQIAEILDIPVGTVKSRLHAAVNHFARLWRAAEPTLPSAKS